MCFFVVSCLFLGVHGIPVYVYNCFIYLGMFNGCLFYFFQSVKCLEGLFIIIVISIIIIILTDHCHSTAILVMFHVGPLPITVINANIHLMGEIQDGRRTKMGVYALLNFFRANFWACPSLFPPP